jgi:ATP-dependent protease HslVU (ClpYQ) ATPase subunit
MTTDDIVPELREVIQLRREMTVPTYQKWNEILDLIYDAADEIDKQDVLIKQHELAIDMRNAEIARLAKANQEWCDKWERMVCEYCGWRQDGEVTHD